LNVSTRSGRIRVTAREGAALEVHGGHIETDVDGAVTVAAVRGGSSGVEIVCATGTDVAVGTASGHIELLGWLGEVHVSSRSGKIKVESAERVDVRTASGSIEVGFCETSCRIVAKSARVRVRKAGSLEVSAMSGRVEVDDVDDACVRTMSGVTRLGTGAIGRVEVRTLSGAIEIAVPHGRRPATHLRSLSGRVRCEPEPGHDGEIIVKSTSGTIDVKCR
jgi:hypothetical protein